MTRKLSALVLACFVSLSVLSAQTEAPAAPSQPSSAATPEHPRSGTEGVSPQRSTDSGAEKSTPEAQPSPSPSPEKITPEQVEQLRQSMDDILSFASKETGLPIRSKVKLQLRSRDDVHRFLEERMKNNKDTERLAQSELVMKKLGLLPHDFNLRTFIVAAYSEQVAGYYDSKTKSMCLLDWVPFDEQRPVMAHELTHALQDQRISLDKWLDADAAVGKKEPAAQRDAALDELRLARDSVAEGQAMVVLWDYNLLPYGLNVETAGDQIKAFTSTMLDAKDSPQMAKAPLYIRRGLVFPYREGLEFERQVLIKRGKTGAFIGTLDDPPVSSRQVMEPNTYLSGEKIPQLKVADFKRVLGSDWAAADFGAIGQIDVTVMLQLYQNEKLSDELAPQWRGGYYYAARKKGAPPSDIAFLYVSRWADEASAKRFAEIYAASWKQRYRRIDLQSLENGQAAATEQGGVSVARDGSVVVAIESFPDVETLKLRQASFAVNKSDSSQGRVVPMRLRPALDISAYLCGTTAIGSHPTSIGKRIPAGH